MTDHAWTSTAHPAACSSIATVRLAGTELDRATRQAQLMASTPPMDLAWVAMLAAHVGSLAEAFAVGDETSAVLTIRKMQADLEACKTDIAGRAR